jgi:hypothetical protein
LLPRHLGNWTMALSSKNIRTLGNIVKNLEIEKYKCEMFTNYGDVHAYLHHGFASFLLLRSKSPLDM